MQKLLVITIMLVLATPGCLDSLKDDLVSCDNITGQCRYEILRANVDGTNNIATFTSSVIVNPLEPSE